MASQDDGMQSTPHAEPGQERLKYRKRAKLLAGKILRPGVRHPWTEGELAFPSRTKIYEFENGRPTTSLDVNTLEEISLYCQNTAKAGSPSKPKRRLITMEDMDSDLVEVLGVEFGIPPHFFLAHCDFFSSLYPMDQTYRRKSGSTYWSMPVPQRRILRHVYQGPNANYSIEMGSFRRWSIVLNKAIKAMEFYNYVSCWSVQHGNGSWTTVVLVDPAKSHLELLDDLESAEETFELGDWSPDRFLRAEVVDDPSVDDTLRLSGVSMYDDISNAHERAPYIDTTPNPFCATNYTRNIIRAAWDQSIRDREGILNDMVAYDQEAHLSYLQSSRSGPEAQYESTIRAYQELMVYQAEIQAFKGHLRDIIEVFRLTGLQYRADGGHDTRFVMSMEEDEQVWRFLQEKVEAMEKLINEHMGMYSQRAAFMEWFAANTQAQAANRQATSANEQALSANKQARSSGQLAKIATVIVPCTFVASIFSMGGDFAAGERYFYIYWAVSIPVTFVLLCWVLHEDVKSFWRTSKLRWKRIERGTDFRVAWHTFFRSLEQKELLDLEKGEKTH